MLSGFRLGVSQMTSTEEVEVNLRTLLSLYREAVEQSADLVMFPENSLFHRVTPGSAIQGLELGGKILCEIEAEVGRSGVPVLLTTPVRTSSGRLENSTLWVRAGARAEIAYSKIHLFDVDVVGAPPVRESDSFLAGREPRILEVNGWKFGLSICYDLRFSELYLRYAQKVDAILVPAAFLVPTGEAHWHVLLRARAIECQCFVAAAAQSGVHVGAGGQSRSTYGHSLVVDPWGKILDENLESPQVHVVELNRELIQRVRGQIPMAAHRRLQPS